MKQGVFQQAVKKPCDNLPGIQVACLAKCKLKYFECWRNACVYSCESMGFLTFMVRSWRFRDRLNAYDTLWKLPKGAD